MKLKQIGVMAGIILLASLVSGLLAYRLGLRNAAHRPGPPAATSAADTGRAECTDFRDAGPRVGETGCVSGRVLRVSTSKSGNTFLDFCPDYRTCPFVTVIFSSDREKFGDLSTLSGRQVEIHGPITTYQGRAQIIIRDPQQIRVLP